MPDEEKIAKHREARKARRAAWAEAAAQQLQCPGAADLREELCTLLNRYSAENHSDTPDFILAAYLLTCLDAFDTAVKTRERWYGRGPKTTESPDA